eukprot:TRINITY_DN1424_c0_g1_i7.p1 TRINITY_DN1424_c0_g1~~TRINITY_DN1424_c0_g1_i7.p1  ORF type:complete len:842 (+),score=163.49 TRINITY_DN1424_c0_g1_i7:2598-5123(+)
MQPLTSDSDADLSASPAYLQPLYLDSSEMRTAYSSLRNDAIAITPPTRAIDVAPPSDQQLALPCAVQLALHNVPLQLRPLVHALWKAPQLAVLHGYSRSHAATALAHALNLRRAAAPDSARAVLVLPRVASAAKLWQRQLSAALDEIKLTTLRSVRAPRHACLNCLRREQYPGVVIVADKSLKDVCCWNELRNALAENRLLNGWDMVISEVRGGDGTLNLYHSPFRLVADKHARSGMFVMCSDDVARVRKEHFSKHAVRHFVRTQLPSLSSLNDDSIWITPATVGRHGAAAANKHTLPNTTPTKSLPNATTQSLAQLRRKADALVMELNNTPPTNRQVTSKLPQQKDEVHSGELHHSQPITRSLSAPLNTSRTPRRTQAARAPRWENAKSTVADASCRKSDAFRENPPPSAPNQLSTTPSRLFRTPRRPSLQHAQSGRSHDRRSLSVVEISDDESHLVWHTPPTQIVAPTFFSDDDLGSNHCSDNEHEWKTAIASRRRSNRSSSRSATNRTKSRNARLSAERMRRSAQSDNAALTLPSRELTTSSNILDAGLESPDTFSSTRVVDSEMSAQGASARSVMPASRNRNEALGRTTTWEQQNFDSRLGPRRSLSAENLLHAEEVSTPSSSPIATTKRHSGVRSYFASNRRNQTFATPSVRRNIPFVEIPDSDVEVIDVDHEVIDLCSDDEDSGQDKVSPVRRVEARRNRRASSDRSAMRRASFESQDDQHVSYGSSLILTGVTKYNPKPTESERKKYNTLLRMARKAEARGPEGYRAAIKLYTRCLDLCDGDDNLTNRILSLTSETGLLSNKDFYEDRMSAAVAKRTRPPRRRIRRICSSDSSS